MPKSLEVAEPNSAQEGKHLDGTILLDEVKHRVILVLTPIDKDDLGAIGKPGNLVLVVGGVVEGGARELLR